MDIVDEPRWRVSVLLPAAGVSERMGGPLRKPLLPLGDEPMLLRTCRALAAAPGVEEIVVALHPDDLEAVRESHGAALRSCGASLLVAGGACRAESVWNALQVSDPANELVAVHDAARPFPSVDLCTRLFALAARCGAAIPVLDATDTLKRIEGGHVTETVAREGLRRVQTPQVFSREILLDAFEYALATGGLSNRCTDDASLVEAFGREVRCVWGEARNIKLTTQEDLAMARALLALEALES